METRSAQVYKVIPDDAVKIKKRLSFISGSKSFPKIENLKIDKETGNVLGELHIRKYRRDDTFESFYYDFVFKIKSKKLYLMGRSLARSLAVNTLNMHVNEKTYSISDLKFTNSGMIETLFGKIKKGSTANFIRKINLTFGIGGLKYHNKTPLYKMSYELIDDTCVSTHINFKKFTKGASWITTTFGIWSLSHLQRDLERDKAASLRVSMNYSFSLGSDTSRAEWVDLLDRLV